MTPCSPKSQRLLERPRATRPASRRRATLLLPLACLTLLSIAAICGPAEQESSDDLAPTAQGSIEASPSPEPAEGATPTPEPPSSAFGFDGTANLPSPASSDEAMLLGGVLWVDARPATGEVFAYIGGVECGRGRSLLLPDGGPPDFLIAIASAAERLGCGTPGAEIVLTINGREMNEPIRWRPGFQQPLNVVAGPAFSQYQGTIRFDSSFIPLRVVPYVDGVACGEQLNSFQGTTEVFYQVVVDPDELRPGCGRAGSVIELRLEGTSDAGAADIALDTAAWEPGAIVKRPTIDVAQGASATPEPTAGQSP